MNTPVHALTLTPVVNRPQDKYGAQNETYIED